MKWIKRGLLGLASFVLLLIVVLVGFIVFDASFGKSSAELTNITFTNAAGFELQGYLAMPEGDGPFPAVLLIHEWWG